MSTLLEKMEKVVQLSAADCKDCFAIPGADNIIDVIHPTTGLSWFQGLTLEEMRERDKRPEIVQMTVEEFCRQKAERQDGPVQWIETTLEHFEEMLNVLPPKCYSSKGFLVGEPWDHHAKSGQPRYQALLSKDGKYLSSSRPMTVAEYRDITK